MASWSVGRGVAGLRRRLRRRCRGCFRSRPHSNPFPAKGDAWRWSGPCRSAHPGAPGEDCARIEANRLGLLTDDAEGSLGAPVSNVHHNEPKTSAPFLRLRAGTLLSMLDRTTRRRRLAPRADVRRGPRHHVRERPVAADLVSPDRSRVASPRSRARFCADRRSLAPRSSRYSGADHWSEKLAYATTFDSWGSQLFSAIAK